MKIFYFSFLSLLCSQFVFASDSVILTPSIGGDSIKASSVQGEFTSLSDLVFKETDHSQIGPDNTDLVIKLPENFEFDTENNLIKVVVDNTKLDESGNCAGAGNKTLRLGTSSSGATSQSLTATENSITLHIKQASAGNCKGLLTFQGLKVRPISSSIISTGNIFFEGTTEILGLNQSDTSLGELKMIDDIERDTEAPVLTLLGEKVMTLEVFSPFVDPGVNVSDNKDIDLEFVSVGEVDTNTLGEYEIKYSAVDSSLNEAESLSRIVQVVDTKAPVLILNGENMITVYEDETYTDQGALASDIVDGDLTQSIITSGLPIPNTKGTYTVSYSVTDSSDNVATITRTLERKEKVIVIDNQNQEKSGGNSGSRVFNPQTYFNKQNTNEVVDRLPSSPEVLGVATEECFFIYEEEFSSKDSEAVRKIQSFLNKELFLLIPETGEFGKLTRMALQIFAIKHNLDAQDEEAIVELINNSACLN